VSEQVVDLRSTVAILRRNRVVLVGAAVLGLAAGGCYVPLRPAMYTSSSLVLLPPPAQTSSGQVTSRDVETEVRIASSDVVLGPAGAAVSPQMSAHTVARRVDINAPTSDVIQIKASARTPALAEALSQAVADADVTYLKEAASSLSNAQLAALTARGNLLQASLDSVTGEIHKTVSRGQNEDPTSAAGKADAVALAQLTAQQASLALKIDQVKEDAAKGSQPLNQTGAAATVIQAASPAARPGLVGRLLVFGFLGLAVAVALTALVLTAFGRRDRRLRYRDEMADALGSAVIGSIRSRMPRSVAGWASLLENYTPGTVDAWALRQALRQLVLGESASGARSGDERGAKPRHPVSVTVLTLADDPRGLAVAPQIASYAASVGVTTRFVALQRHESAAALWAACSNLSDYDEVRPGLVVDTQADQPHDVDLTIVLAVLDRRRPELTLLPRASVTILAVSSGSATAEDLARAAVTADEAGSRIDGILVADPDSLDRTTGRLSQQERLHQVALPTRLTGATVAEGTATNVSGLFRRPR
jgi:subunit length determinant Wzz-like protein